jgi:hypothetical protein
MTQSVLAFEVYEMINDVDIRVIIETTVDLITDQLKLLKALIIVCTDSYSLYECLVKLAITKEKHLMIDIMTLRQSYKNREFEVR